MTIKHVKSANSYYNHNDKSSAHIKHFSCVDETMQRDCCDPNDLNAEFRYFNAIKF